MSDQPYALTSTRAYGERIGRVTDHILNHLDQPLDLDRLAGIACFSPWHFHRVYRAVTGETVADTYRRYRLHRAARELIETARPVSAVAARAGFGSSAAFIRAFSADYGCPPGQFRRQRTMPTPRTPAPKELTAMPQVEIVELPELPLIGLHHKGDYNSIGAAFERVGNWAGSRGLLGPQTRMFGLYYDDPDVTPRASLRSIATVTVAAEASAEPPFERLALPPGRYARAVHKGPYVDLHAFYLQVFRGWFPTSGEEPGDGPCVEEYLNNPQSLPATDWLTAVYLPLK